MQSPRAQACLENHPVRGPGTHEAQAGLRGRREAREQVLRGSAAVHLHSLPKLQVVGGEGGPGPCSPREPRAGSSLTRQPQVLLWGLQEALLQVCLRGCWGRPQGLFRGMDKTLRYWA